MFFITIDHFLSFIFRKKYKSGNVYVLLFPSFAGNHVRLSAKRASHLQAIRVSLEKMKRLTEKLQR